MEYLLFSHYAVSVAAIAIAIILVIFLGCVLELIAHRNWVRNENKAIKTISVEITECQKMLLPTGLKFIPAPEEITKLKKHIQDEREKIKTFLETGKGDETLVHDLSRVMWISRMAESWDLAWMVLMIDGKTAGLRKYSHRGANLCMLIGLLGTVICVCLVILNVCALIKQHPDENLDNITKIANMTFENMIPSTFACSGAGLLFSAIITCMNCYMDEAESYILGRINHCMTEHVMPVIFPERITERLRNFDNRMTFIVDTFAKDTEKMVEAVKEVSRASQSLSEKFNSLGDQVTNRKPPRNRRPATEVKKPSPSPEEIIPTV